jgi:hypothetical protein
MIREIGVEAFTALSDLGDCPITVPGSNAEEARSTVGPMANPFASMIC